MVPLIASAFTIWYLYLYYYGELKDLLKTPEVEALGIPEKVRNGYDYPQIVGALQKVHGVVPELTVKCMLRMHNGLNFREAFGQCRHEETAKYTYAFYILGAMVTAAPLLGLLGTVLGMIETFTGVGAETSSHTAGAVASGISKALITTQVGLVAALPGTFGLVHLYRLYRRLENIISKCESHLAVVCEHEPEKFQGNSHG